MDDGILGEIELDATYTSPPSRHAFGRAIQDHLKRNDLSPQGFLQQMGVHKRYMSGSLTNLRMIILDPDGCVNREGTVKLFAAKIAQGIGLTRPDLVNMLKHPHIVRRDAGDVGNRLMPG